MSDPNGRPILATAARGASTISGVPLPADGARPSR